MIKLPEYFDTYFSFIILELILQGGAYSVQSHAFPSVYWALAGGIHAELGIMSQVGGGVQRRFSMV